jgi:very-short-patch-repair endonuclease
MDALERYGYQCTPQLGVAGYRIDLAVKHPNYPSAYLAAIECDGAAYHSGRSARDRDRIRQEILERLGWKGRIHRIWSTDWYRTPAQELGRLLQWLERLKSVPIDDAYLAAAEPEVIVEAMAPSSEAVAVGGSVESSLESLGVKIDSDEPREVQVGDKVTYVLLGQDRELTVTIGTKTDETQGLIDYRTPLADALLGLQEGELAALAQPGRPTLRLRIVKVDRPREAVLST